MAPAAAETSNSFQGAGGFSYTFEPETGNYVITAAPEDYAHLTGVTVRPGSRAYDSIQAEHQTGTSLYQAEAQDEAPETVDVEGEETVITADPVDEPVEEFDVEQLGDVSRIGPGAQELAPEAPPAPAPKYGMDVPMYSVEEGPYAGRAFDPRSRAQILREEAAAKAMENKRMLEEARRGATMFGGGRADSAPAATPKGSVRIVDEDSGLTGDTGG